MEKQKVCIVTGANTGIGKYTALGMVKAGYFVVLACRSEERGTQAIDDIARLLAGVKVVSDAKEDEGSKGKRAEEKDKGKEEDKGEAKKDEKQDQEIKKWKAQMRVMQLELADLDAVRKFATEFTQEYSSLHCLILNAGVVTPAKKESTQGHEMMFAVNHLGHFLLTVLLLDNLKKGGPSRIVVVGSAAHKFPGALKDRKQITDCPNFNNAATAMKVYGRSKLCNLLFTHELAKRLIYSPITVNCVHPGAVDTELQRDAPKYLAWLTTMFSRHFFLTSEDGAKTTLYVALSEDLANVTGKYFEKEALAKPKEYAVDDESSLMLWEFSEELCDWKWGESLIGKKKTKKEKKKEKKEEGKKEKEKEKNSKIEKEEAKKKEEKNSKIEKEEAKKQEKEEKNSRIEKEEAKKEKEKAEKEKEKAKEKEQKEEAKKEKEKQEQKEKAKKEKEKEKAKEQEKKEDAKKEKEKEKAEKEKVKAKEQKKKAKEKEAKKKEKNK